MRAKPRTWTYLDGDEGPKVHWGPKGAFVFLECEVTDPPSSAGRTVQVLLEGEMIVHLLRELRTAAIAQRQTTDPTTARSGS